MDHSIAMLKAATKDKDKVCKLFLLCMFSEGCFRNTSPCHLKFASLAIRVPYKLTTVTGNKHNQTNAMSSYGPGNGYFIPQTHAGQPGAGMKFYASDTNDNSRNPPIPTENAALDLNRYYPTPTYQMYGHGRSKSESYDPAAAHATAVGYNTSIDGRIEAHRGAELASGLTPEDFRDSDDEMQDREVDSSSYHERELVAENEESADSNEGDEEGNSSEEFNENYALCSGKDEAPVSSGMRSAKSADKGKGKAKK